jgi:hypothetical protein
LAVLGGSGVSNSRSARSVRVLQKKGRDV